MADNNVPVQPADNTAVNVKEPLRPIEDTSEAMKKKMAMPGREDFDVEGGSGVNPVKDNIQTMDMESKKEAEEGWVKAKINDVYQEDKEAELGVNPRGFQPWTNEWMESVLPKYLSRLGWQSLPSGRWYNPDTNEVIADPTDAAMDKKTFDATYKEEVNPTVSFLDNYLKKKRYN